MERFKLKDVAQRIALDLESKSYDYWLRQPFPIVYEDEEEGEWIEIEVQLLERKKDYLQLGVSVRDESCCKRILGLTICFPVSYSALIRRGESEV